MNRPRLVRALRITWTAFWGIAAVLLLCLWVRSYWRTDAVSHDGHRILTTIESLRGEIEFSQSEDIDSHGTTGSEPLFNIRSSDLLPERNSADASFSFTRGPYDGDREIGFPDWSAIVVA